MKFHSPYQFIQVTGRRGQGTSDPSQGGVVPYPGAVVPQEAQHSQQDQNPLPPEQPVHHDRWQRGTYSGRLVCRLTTRSPLLVGAEQSSGACDATPGVIEPFRVQEGLAIPGSALRGLLSSVAETVSQSALRVLDNKEYSVRKGVREGLRARSRLRRCREGDGGRSCRTSKRTLFRCPAVCSRPSSGSQTNAIVRKRAN